jgi:molecular chaperone Hsp33
MAHYLRVLAGENNDVLIAISDSTSVSDRAQRIHQTTPVVSAALGRVLTATHLMSIFLKGDKTSVSLQILGSSALKKTYAYADARGTLKGYVSDPSLVNRIKENGKLDVGGVIGRHGKLIVSRDTGFGQPFVGQSDLVSGEIAEDLAFYYAHSEQQPSIVSLGVLVSTNSEQVMASGGLFIQPLPDCSEQSLSQLEAKLPNFRPMSDLLQEGLTLEEILQNLLGDMPFKVLMRGEFEYQCDCDHEKIETAILTLGIEELSKIAREDHQMELTCHFCAKKYHFCESDLKKIIYALQQDLEE